MKYTKDNIEGIIFLGPTDPYTIKRVEGHDVIMGYHTDHSSYCTREFSNTLAVTLSMLNDGTWKPIGTLETQLETYQIY